MNNILISQEISAVCPQLVLGCISAKVLIEPSESEQIKLMEEIVATKTMAIDDIKDIAAIRSSRDAYRALGKDPSRYRLSAEALHRRVLQGKGLYYISNVVDIINLISLKSGYSIGGYDADKIVGNLTFTVGKSTDDYEAIGRGKLNIESLPVFRDELGVFGSPTSDSLRTMITNQTEHILLIFINFGNHSDMAPTLLETADLLRRFAGATNIIL